MNNSLFQKERFYDGTLKKPIIFAACNSCYRHDVANVSQCFGASCIASVACFVFLSRWSKIAKSPVLDE